MILTYFWSVCVLCSVIFAFITGTAAETSSALTAGAANAIKTCISIAGPLALWSGLGKLMEQLNGLEYLSRLFAPLIHRIFPSTRSNAEIAKAISGNLCANLLGLGNAATPLGIKAVQKMQNSSQPDTATHEMCRLVVMNTASIQLLPTTVAAVRASAGCIHPFDIIPCVWISSILSVCAGLLAAWIMGRIYKNA